MRGFFPLKYQGRIGYSGTHITLIGTWVTELNQPNWTLNHVYGCFGNENSSFSKSYNGAQHGEGMVQTNF